MFKILQISPPLITTFPLPLKLNDSPTENVRVMAKNYISALFLFFSHKKSLYFQSIEIVTNKI